MSRRYALFQGDTYYPAGGWLDFVGMANSPGLLREVLVEQLGSEKRRIVDQRWYQIVDLETQEIVEEGSIAGLLWSVRVAEGGSE